ncbi:MAG: hypothetical protein HZB13_14430 [Acidobacteria bacterium]|nr:hypothetical protein [Acidobacteriota bacterium]
MTTAIVLLQYKQRILEHQMAFDGALSAQRFAAAAALAALLLVVAGWLACSRRAIPAWSPAVPLPVVVLSLRAHARGRAEAHRIRRLLGFYQRGEDRLEDRWAGKGQHGQAFEPPAHPYAGDLNLFGEGSVFERICTARTHLGRERLAQYLLEPAGGGEVLARQEAVRELRGQVALREKMALLGHSDFEDSH